MSGLDGKTAIITGAADGMGRATAVKLAKEGVDTLLVDLNGEGLEETAGLAGAQGRRAVPWVADLADRKALHGIVPAAIHAFGGVDILVNNAGVSRPRPIQDYEIADLDLTMAVNFKAPFLLAVYAARHMVEAGKAGRIVNITSINAEVAAAGSAAYSATKGALRQATKAMAYELGPHGITVNAVGPGYTRTGMTRPIFSCQPERAADWVAKTPLGRVGEPEDIANAVAFLVSDEASYVTGQTVYVEGGRTIWT